MNGRPDIKCHHCCGGGLIPLPDEYWETLQALRRLNRPASATELRERAGDGKCHPSKYCNQLSRMRKWGVVRLVRKDGKTKFYEPA